MGGEFDALGDAVTGALVARAVEPAAGEIGPDGRTHETHCLNCGTELVGSFCHACGQHAHVRRTLTSLAHDFLNGMLNFEGKIWRTLPLLAWKPGELTRRYIDGQRARFISPIALFLFCVFLMFGAVSLFGSLGEMPEAAKQDFARELRKDETKLAVLEQQRPLMTGAAAKKLDDQIGDLRGEITAMKAAGGGKTKLASSGLPWWLAQGLDTAAKDPEMVAYKLQNNASKFGWLIIPLSVPFVWLLFPFSRRFRAYDHTVFVTYSLCFMMLLVVAGIIFQAGGMPSLAGMLWLLPPIHIYRQLKGAYALGRWGALWRTMLLTIFALMVVVLFVALIVGMGMFE